jgi:catechol 2,3-dioxygenase-like lactoylglutathione lyase family enzyme
MSGFDPTAPRPKAGPRLHHLALRAADVEATVAFYRDMLGLAEVRAHRPRSVWLGLGDGAVLMVETREAGEPAVAHGSLELTAFRVGEQEKLAIRARARERGCFDGETAHTVYLRDPDGRRIGVSTFPLEPT